MIQDQDEKGKPIDLKPVINAVGVDPVSGDIWIAVDDELVHYNSTGDRKGETYRTFTAEGTRVAPVSILVEPSRLLLAADPIGVYAFARPDKMGSNPEPKAGGKIGSQAYGETRRSRREARSNLSKTIVSIACEIRGLRFPPLRCAFSQQMLKKWGISFHFGAVEILCILCESCAWSSLNFLLPLALLLCTIPPRITGVVRSQALLG